MRKLIALFSLLMSLPALAEHKFMPDNSLWQDDCLACESNTMTEDVFNKIVEAGRTAYAVDATINNEKLVINARWTDSTVNANCSRYSGKVTVNMYGGLARRQEINIEGFALVLGHELSHAYGGEPYIDTYRRMAAEGQSDYMAAKVAYDRIAALVPELRADMDVADFVKDACKDRFGDAFTDCTHNLEGGKALGALLATLMKEPIPQYETPDLTVVTETETSYPSTVQCRVDTYLAGTFGNPRPACWFKEPDVVAFRWYY